MDGPGSGASLPVLTSLRAWDHGPAAYVPPQACGREQAGAGHLARTWQRPPCSLPSVPALEGRAGARDCAAAGVLEHEKEPQ